MDVNTEVPLGLPQIFVIVLFLFTGVVNKHAQGNYTRSKAMITSSSMLTIVMMLLLCAGALIVLGIGSCE